MAFTEVSEDHIIEEQCNISGVASSDFHFSIIYCCNRKQELCRGSALTFFICTVDILPVLSTLSEMSLIKIEAHIKATKRKDIEMYFFVTTNNELTYYKYILTETSAFPGAVPVGRPS